MVIVRKDTFESHLSTPADDKLSRLKIDSVDQEEDTFQKFCIQLRGRELRPLHSSQSILRTSEYREVLRRYSLLLLLFRSLALITLIELFLLLE